MTPAQQERRFFIQARCIRKLAKKRKISFDSAGELWCSSGLARQWKNYYD